MSELNNTDNTDNVDTNNNENSPVQVPVQPQVQVPAASSARSPSGPTISDVGLQVLARYFNENAFAPVKHHIDSFENAVFADIPSIIHASNPIVFLKGPLDAEASKFSYRVEIFIGGDAATPADLALQIKSPTVNLDEGNTVRHMFPNEARLRDLTYSITISADILIRAHFTAQGADGNFVTTIKDAPIIRAFKLFDMPILLRSSLCVTSTTNPILLDEMGECRNDYGGYFIIGGSEKVLICRGEQAYNTLYAEKKPPSDDQFAAYASVVSLHPETKQTRRVALTVGRRNGEIRVSIPMVRGSFPLFILFRAMGEESDESIVRRIFPNVDDPESQLLQQDLIPSIEDAYPIHNRFTAIKYIMSLTKGFTQAHVLDILQNLMLPHVPDEPMARVQYLSEMTRDLLRTNAGLRAKTDRDDMRSQRFLPTGTLVRELFNGAWKDWRAAVILSIDRTYRGAADGMYVGENIFDLFAGSNIQNLFQPATLNKAIQRGFRGRWGTNERNEKSGVLQPLARISYLDALSHTRRVVSDFDTGMKTTGPRKLHTSHTGYFCTSETPTGAHIGATKNMSLMTLFSIGAPTKPVYDWMTARGFLIPVAETTAAIRVVASMVQINAGTVGFTLMPRELVATLRLLKWNACLSPTASISFNTTDQTVRILLDEGRPVRPLWHGSNGNEGVQSLFALREQVATGELLNYSWNTLIFGTGPLAETASMRLTTFTDPLAEAPFQGAPPTAIAAAYNAALGPSASFIEYCDPVESNEAYISWWGGDDLTPEHTHVEIHPSTMLGIMASMIPFSNHNQAPRNQLSNSQSKQGIGYMSTVPKRRFGTYEHQLCYGEAPLCRTFTYETIANGEMPYGTNCIIAATSESGYNQDDGLIINRDSVARGMFQSLSFRSYTCAEEVDAITKVHSHVANPRAVPSWTSLRPGLDFSKLDERGIIREGEWVDENTVLVGCYSVIPDTHDIKDTSVSPGLYTQGRVDSVVVLHQGDNHLLVKIRILEVRLPDLGDKFSSRHGQKGTIGMLVYSTDLPFTVDGIVPDVMVNPGGLISRMTVAQLLEMIAGRAAAEVCAKMNATTFCNGPDFVTQVGDVLEAAGCSREGDTILYSGITGAQIHTAIFMCPLYFMRLKHLTADKVNSRSAGRREIRTHQPTGGRANEGGLRIGEMERDSLCTHGVTQFLKESMMERGDGAIFWVCNGCGRIPIYNEQESLYVCPNCDGPLSFSGLTSDTLTIQMPTGQSRATFSKVAMPYTMKLFDQETTALINVGFRFVTEGTITRLRESSWSWPAEVVDFTAGVGVAAAVERVAKELPPVPESKSQKAKSTTKAKAKTRKLTFDEVSALANAEAAAGTAADVVSDGIPTREELRTAIRAYLISMPDLKGITPRMIRDALDSKFSERMPEFEQLYKILAIEEIDDLRDLRRDLRREEVHQTPGDEGLQERIRGSIRTFLKQQSDLRAVTLGQIRTGVKGAFASMPERQFKELSQNIALEELDKAITENENSVDIVQVKSKPVVPATIVATKAGVRIPEEIRFYSKLENEYKDFSNFAPIAFTMSRKQFPSPDGTAYPEFPMESPVVWSTVEHYYQASKFPTDPTWQKAIWSATSPASAKTMGTSRDAPLRKDWEQIKEAVMLSALKAKFKQNPRLLSLLQSTGVAPLVEASPGDRYWGIGKDGKGLNRMGKLLEKVREKFKGERPDLTVMSGGGCGGRIAPQSQPGAGSGAGAGAVSVSAPSDLAAAVLAAQEGGGPVNIFIGSSRTTKSAPRARTPTRESIHQDRDRDRDRDRTRTRDQEMSRNLDLNLNLNSDMNSDMNSDPDLGLNLNPENGNSTSTEFDAQQSGTGIKLLVEKLQ